MKKQLLLIASAWLLCMTGSVAQTRNPGLDIMRTNIWRFGFTNGSFAPSPPGLDFSSGSPVVFNCGQKPVGDGATTISDTDGNMLLSGGYGGSCYECPRMFDRTCDTMANSGVVGDIGWVGSGRTNIAIPMPKSPNLIYYFSTSMTLTYTVVDMNLNGGMGAVILRNDTLDAGPTGVKMAAVHHCNGSDIWVVGTLWGTDTVYAYLLTDTGITRPPIYTKIEPMDNLAGFFQAGRMQFSNDGNKVAIGYSGGTYPSYLFDFDKSAGIVSNPVQLHIESADAIEFSPDNSVLYIAGLDGMLAQYNLKAGSDSAIIQSRIVIANDRSNPWSAAQLGRDGKIYLTPRGSLSRFYLDVINQPNALDTLCDFQTRVIFLNEAKNTSNSLMNTVGSYFYTGSSAYPCYGDTAAISIAASETNLGIRVYPNPFSDYATIDIPNVLFTNGKMEYLLFDMVGKEYEALITERNYGIAQLHRGQLNPGIYLLAIKLYGKTQTFKIFIL